MSIVNVVNRRERGREKERRNMRDVSEQGDGHTCKTWWAMCARIASCAQPPPSTMSC
jgi:hypothetical protein